MSGLLTVFKVLFVETPEEIALRTAQREMLEGAWSELRGLPQFIEMKTGLLNVLNGCHVSIEWDMLMLLWNPVGGTSDDPRYWLTGQDSVTRFVEAMKAQARGLGIAGGAGEPAKHSGLAATPAIAQLGADHGV